jgi:hypothetical protein
MPTKSKQSALETLRQAHNGGNTLGGGSGRGVRVLCAKEITSGWRRRVRSLDGGNTQGEAVAVANMYY